MRSTSATLSVCAGSTSSNATPIAPTSSSQAIPTIRLISATPSAAGLSSSEGSNTSFASSELNDTFASKPTILAKSPSLSLKPKASTSSLNPANKGRLVPKKSKLSLLGLGGSNQNGSQNGGQTTEKDRDLSDVLRRVGVSHEGSSKGKGGFEIYVDPTEDPEFGEIVMIRKKKSRAGLDGVRWGDEGAERADGPLKEKNSNVQNGGKMQEGGKEKWWTIGRGKKEAKDKTQKTKAKSPLSQVLDENSNASTTTSTTRFNSFSKVLPRSFTPEPSTTAPERSRFNSLDSTTLLTSSKLHPITNPIHNGSLRATSNPSPVPLRISQSTQLENQPPAEPAYSRAGTPTFGGFLAPPGLTTTSTTTTQSGTSGNANVNQGSIALRAMRSVRSLARIGSWAQLRNGDDEETAANSEPVKGEGKKEKRDKEKKDKKGSVKKSKDKASEKEKKKEKKSKEKSQTLRVSTSSFEVGALSPARSLRPPVSHDGSLKEPKSLGKKRSTLLGLGLPSTMTMRLPSVRGGSNASSILVNGNNPSSNTLAPGTASVGRVFLTGRDRSESGASSLRPMSTSSGVSSNSGYSARTSTASERTGTSKISNGSCASASVRWDEDALRKRRKEREREREAVRSLATRGEERGREQEEKGKKEKKEKGSKKGRESRRTSEGRKRTPINEVFPDAVSLTPPKENPILEYKQALRSPVLEEEEEDVEMPIWQVQVETATNDGHGGVTDDERMSSDTQTPIKKVRRRPMSEQLLGTMQGGRPKGGYFGSDDGTDGTMSILSAATNELAQLINNLDLEATPNTPDLTPLRPSPSLSAANTPSQSNTNSPSREGQSKSLLPESPLRGLRASMASITSLRPYAQSRDLTRGTNEPTIQSQQCHQFNIGVEIAPWPTLRSVAPTEQLKTQPTATVTPSRLKHKRATMLPSPGPPPAEPSPVFQPLKPAKGRGRLADAFVQQSPSEPAKEFRASRAPSCLTFGSHSRSSSAKSGSVLDEAQPSPLGSVFKQSHSRKKSSLSYSVSLNPHDDGDQSDSMPIPPEAKRVLGMTGTMGASVAEGYAVELDASDPDSDIPDELQVLLAGQSDLEDTMEFPRSAITTASPPSLGGVLNVSAASDYPPFRAHLIDEEDNHADIDAGQSSSDDDDTKKSFDFTGELKVLNESGASDRRSFVEQLENAFKTPAKLEFKFGEALLQVDVPPVPALPKLIHSQEETSQSSSDLFSFDSNPSEQIIDVKEPTFTGNESQANSDSLAMLKSASEFIMDVEPMMLPGSDSLAYTDSLISSIGGSDQELEEEHLDIPHPRRFTSSTGSRPSVGQLNVDFKFGGRPTPQPAEPRPLTLSDIIPSPAHQRKLSNSSFSVEDDSVLHSILAKASDLLPIAPPLSRQRLDSDCSSKQRARDTARTSMAGGHSRTHSADSARMSFIGFESFDEVRRGFEFSGPRPAFYPPPAAISNRSHLRQESGMSFASISSYGHVINAGVADPFDYALPSLQERPSSEDMSCSDSMSMTVDDTFSFIRRQPRRRRIDSNASSFYFRTSMISQIQPYARGHGRQESNMSVASLAPPVSLYNRSFAARHHRRNSSTTSASSVAQSYAMHGISGGRATWARHRQDASMDSMMSEYSAMRLGRPGLGDKMFETSGDQGMPLSAISASPPDSAAASRSNLSAARDSYEYDSIMDNDPVSTIDDSLFDKTGHRSSLSSESIFGDDASNPIPGHLLLPHQFRPLSMLSVRSTDRGPSREDDTMISMIGGGHVRRQSISSVIDGSPCVRMGRKKKDLNSVYDSPGQARIVEKPSIASTSSYQFGGERMIKAQRGLLARQSLEETCLIADGEDLSASFIVPVFSRPGPASRSRSSTCTSSSGGDTPPLSASDGSSISGGSQSSIDLSQLNAMLSNATHPMSNIGRARAHARARARGHGHHRRISQARMSRSSVYETIEEEMSVTSSPARPTHADKKATPVAQQPVYIVDPEMTSMLESSPRSSIWDDDQGLVALRRYYALRDEAEVTVTESRRQWIDTPFSIFALQSFDPPHHPSGMQALLEHSVQNYGPLPSELRPHRVRSRTQSRASPYPPCRTFKVTISPEQQPLEHQRPFTKETQSFAPLQQLNVNSTVDLSVLPVPQADKKLKSPKKGSVASDKNRENAWGLAPNARPRVGSAARRSALGWAKRSGSAKLSTEQKENVGQGSMVVMTPGETLRLNRPRPRGRATPASTRPKPIRV